jgi:tetratricopeptide (TPR) repeat protein
MAAFAAIASPAPAADEPTVPKVPLAGPAAPATAATAAPIMPDEALTKSIAQLRTTSLGAEPTAVDYLDLIAAGHATAPQVNDFAAYLAKRGMPKVALGFQEYAVKLQPADPTLWLNLGTIRRTAGSASGATAAFKKTIELDPGNAWAHYNLGAVYDAEKEYDAAIEEYRRALVLDPDLADPRKNPQVVNNENLLAVKLEIYRNQAGSLGLPLLQMQKPAPKPAPAPASAPVPEKP